METKNTNKKFWVIGGIILLIIIAVVIFIVVKNRKKKKLEEAKDKHSNFNSTNGNRPNTNERSGVGNQPTNVQQPKKPVQNQPNQQPKPTPSVDKKEPSPVMKNSNLSDTRLGSGSGPVQTDAPFVDMVDAANAPQP